MGSSGECRQLGIGECLPGKRAAVPCRHVDLSLYVRGIIFGVRRVHDLCRTVYGNIVLLTPACRPCAGRATEVLDLPSLLDANNTLVNPLPLVEDTASNGACTLGARGSWEG